MPAFILDHGSNEALTQFKKLDAFTQGYIEAMFFTSSGSGDDGDLENATVVELSPQAWARIVEDCADFQESFTDLLEQAYSDDYGAERAGNDFWYTRNRHGVGFWDRALPGDIGKRLTDMAHPYGSCDLYRGDDGALYLS